MTLKVTLTICGCLSRVSRPNQVCHTQGWPSGCRQATHNRWGNPRLVRLQYPGLPRNSKLMKIILTNKGEEILVSDLDYEKLMKYTWYIDSKGYPSTNVKASKEAGTKQRKLRMHKLLLTDAQVVDHINRNKLDNRRSNLRSVTTNQSNANRAAFSSKKASSYKGVHRTASGKWQAMLWHEGKNHGLGSYDTPEEAALAYNAAAKQLRGDHTFLNDIS